MLGNACQPDFWYIDSCSTDHVCNDREKFGKMYKNFKVFNTAGGEITSTVKGNVAVRLFEHVKNSCFTFDVHNVVLVEECNMNLLSLGLLYRDGFSADFDKLILKFPDGFVCRIIADGVLFRLETCCEGFEYRFTTNGISSFVENEGACLPCLSGSISEEILSDPEFLFYETGVARKFRGDNVAFGFFPASLIDSFTETKLQSNNLMAVSNINKDTADVWHSRLGHFNDRYIKKIKDKDGKSLIPVIDHNYDCKSCHLAKSTRPHFPRNLNRPVKKNWETDSYGHLRVPHQGFW